MTTEYKPKVHCDWKSERVEGHPSEAKTVWRCYVGGACVGSVEEYDEGDVWVDDLSDDFDRVDSDVDVMAEARGIVERRVLSAIDPSYASALAEAVEALEGLIETFCEGKHGDDNCVCHACVECDAARAALASIRDKMGVDDGRT